MPNKFQCEFVSLEKVYSLCRNLAEKINAAEYKPDIIVGIARGGTIPARLVCDFLHVHQLTSLKIEHYTSTEKNAEAILKNELNAAIKGKNVLVVDDINDTGKSIIVALEHLKSLGPNQIKVAVMQEKTGSATKADFYIDQLTEWRWLNYQWTLVEDINGFIEKSDCQTIDSCLKMLKEDYAFDFSKQAMLDILPFLTQKLTP